MAMNPMQKRTNNALLIGIIIGILLMGIVVFFMYTQITKLKEENEAMIALQRQFYVLTTDLTSGGELTSTSYTLQTVQTKMNLGNNFNPLTAVDENGNTKKWFAKVALPAGTILTQDMFYAEGEQTENDLRVQEYSNISLPSQLQEGDYIDIRFRLPSGENYIVLSKKRVLKANLDTIWIEVGETEVLTMDNVIVENYIIEGSKLYATIYSEAGMQQASTPTYSVSKKVLELVNKDPNVTEEAKNALWASYKTEFRDGNISSALNEFQSSAASSVTAGTDEEISRAKEQREEYLTMLDGGY